MLTEKPDIARLRREIERVTRQIISLTGRRFRLAKKIAEAKKRENLPVEEREVERNLREIVSRECGQNGVRLDFGLRLLNLLIEEAKRIEKEEIAEHGGEKTLQITPYTFFAKAKELERTGKSLIHLEIGEPDFGPPESVKRRTAQALDSGYARYTETAGIRELRAKIAEKVNQDFHTDISPKQVIVTIGGRYALYLCTATTLLPGDEVIILEPAWPAYGDCVKSLGCKAVRISATLENEWAPDLDLLNQSINESTRMIIMNYPNNPTGKILERKVMKEITETAKEHNLHLVSDEVYSNFFYTPFESVLKFPEGKCTYINSFSKTFGMTGFRIGYAIADRGTVEKMTKLQNLCLTSPPEFVQHAALAALDCVKERMEYARIIEGRLEFTYNALSKLPLSFHKPDGGFYVFPRIEVAGLDGLEFANKLLTQKGVCVTPGVAFGTEYTKFFRVSVCQPQKSLQEAANKMGELLR